MYLFHNVDSYQTVELLDEVSRVTGAMLDKYCQDRVFSKYPVFVRSYGHKILANTSLITNSMKMVDGDSRSILHEVKFSQKEHVLNATTQRMIEILKKRPYKNQIVNEFGVELGEEEPSADNILKILK